MALMDRYFEDKGGQGPRKGKELFGLIDAKG